jgi:peptidoglycan/LPS O-acetylase OafA/YrhL
MGFYRLFLAYVVVLQHVRGPVYGYNLGGTAVISFLLLSGFVMTALIRKYYLTFASVPAFYLDRFIRLGPQFYLYTVLTLLGAIAFGFRHNWMNSVPSARHLFLQFLVVPLNFYRYFQGDLMLPQAWSLGLEAMFYAIFPLILLLRIRLIAATASFAIFLVAYVGILDSDLYGYRYLPGTLFIFICGSWLEQSDSGLVKQLPFFICGLCAILLALTYLIPRFDILYNREVLLGIAIGIPIVFALKAAGSRSEVEELAGDLSYGVFLSHMLVIAAIETIGSVRLTRVRDAALVCVIATILSYASFKSVEQPLIKWRRKLRDVRDTLNPDPRQVGNGCHRRAPSAGVATRGPL